MKNDDCISSRIAKAIFLTFWAPGLHEPVSTLILNYNNCWIYKVWQFCPTYHILICAGERQTFAYYTEVTHLRLCLNSYILTTFRQIVRWSWWDHEIKISATAYSQQNDRIYTAINQGSSQKCTQSCIKQSSRTCFR